MHARRMRWRLFAALGLPAGCMPASAPEDPDAPIIEVAPIAASSEPEPPPERSEDGDAAFAACERDHYRDWVCGNTMQERVGGKENPYATCPASSDRIVRRASVPLGMRNDDPLALDVRLTTVYRERESKRVTNRRPGGNAARDLCCYSSCVRADVRSIPDAPPTGYDEVTRCINAMTETSAPAERQTACAAAIAFEEGPNGPYAAAFNDYMTTYYNRSMQNAAAALPDMQLCCYRSIRKRGERDPQGTIVVPGRPLRDGSGQRLAEPVARDDWSAPVNARDDDARWREAAATEHASVAAFARLALQLLSLGAPPSLIADAHRAAQDEIRHAALSYGVASPQIGPGPLAVADLHLGDIETVAVESFLDGCVEETVAALDAHHAADAARDQALAAIHRRIAEDEERHAALAFRIVAWCLTHAPSTRPALQTALANLDEGHGIRREAIAQIVRPCAEALLA